MKRHLLLAMLLIFCLALLSTNNIYATTPNQQNSDIIANTNHVSGSTVDVQQGVDETTNIQNTTVRTLNEVQTVNNTDENQQTTTTTVKTDNNSNNLNNSSKSSENIQSVTEAAGDVNNNKVPGAQTSVQSITVTYTLNDIKIAASRVKAYIESNQKLPDYVKVGTRQVTMPQFLKLVTAGLLKVKSGSKSSVTLKSVGSPMNPTQNLKNGNIYKTEYLVMAGRILSFINAGGNAPNYSSSTLGKIQYESIVYMYSRIMNYYGTKNVLPSYAAMKSWQKTSNNPTTPVPAALQIYLQPSNNCQSADPTIKTLASSITQGSSSTCQKATNLFNWVRDNIGYSFYYNTKSGALGTLKAKTANCCDTTHLLVALSRAAGIPARYVSGVCKFNSGTLYGHVWAQLYVNGNWYTADAISSRNTFGVINNWDTTSWTLKGIYSELPF